MLLMDLGGWTVDLMRIDNAIPAADTAHSLELGMIRCVDDIREQVRRETELSLTDAQIENMLAGQPCTVSEIMNLPPYYLRRVCRENPDLAFQSGVKWYINLGKLAAYYNNKTEQSE